MPEDIFAPAVKYPKDRGFLSPSAAARPSSAVKPRYKPSVSSDLMPDMRMQHGGPTNRFSDVPSMSGQNEVLLNVDILDVPSTSGRTNLTLVDLMDIMQSNSEKLDRMTSTLQHIETKLTDLTIEIGLMGQDLAAKKRQSPGGQSTV
jgi:hypothetical protein